jgi:hypothetical protein
LLAENIHNLRAKLSQLGLDPNDTTGEELYHALLIKYEKDSANLNKALGIGDKSSFYARSNLAIDWVQHAVKQQTVWALKNPAAKALLKKQPPKKIMKQLHYRSVDSLIKRENVAEVFLALPFFESKSWQQDFETKLRHQGPNNFELKTIQIVKLEADKWGSWSKAKIASSNPMVGAVGLLPTQASKVSPVLTLSLTLGAELEKLHSASVTEQLTNYQPLLAWWVNTEHLLSLHDDQPISLSLKDVSLNHLYDFNYDQRTNQQAQQTFWQELMTRYKKYQQELSAFSYNVSEDVNKSLMPAQELALEYSEA